MFDVAIRVFHFINGFVIFNIVEAHQASILEHPGMQEILIDSHKHVAKQLVEMVDNLGITFHDEVLRCVLYQNITATE